MPRCVLPLLLFCAIPLSASTYVVNDPGDASDAVPGNDACATATAVCTLRAAIQEANAHGGADTITFAIAGTFTPATAYPAITGPLTIDGSSVPGYGTVPLVVVHGAGALPVGFFFTSLAPASQLIGLKIHGFTTTAVSIDAAGVIVRRNHLGPVGGGTANGIGLVLGFLSSGVVVGGNADGLGNVISGNTSHGISISFGTSHTVSDNFIGLDASGTSALPNGGAGVIAMDTTSLTVGGVPPGTENVISGNNGTGVSISGGSSNTVAGNLIGVDATGMAAVPNGGGVSVSSSNSFIGTVGTRNIVSGNRFGGIGGGSGVVIVNNIVGLNAAGTATVPNGGSGAVSASPGATVGTPASGNVISGNSGDGVIAGSGAVIQNNIIGLDPTGAIDFGNGGHGIRASGAVLIGGTGANEGNTISGNGAHGIYQIASSGLRVYGNTIGLTSDRTAARPNLGDGVRLETGNDVRIGSSAGGMNVISGNTANGVSVTPFGLTPSTGVIVEGNRIGTDGAGMTAVPNGQAGVFFFNASGEIRDNLLSGNSTYGVHLRFAGTVGVYGNVIGRNAANAALPNSTGVFLDTNASTHTIGSDVLGANTIASNRREGITIQTGSSNRIGANSIFDNGGLGIDLNDDGVTPNDPQDPDTGANARQNFPVLTAVLTTSSASIIQGFLDSAPATTFTIRFFSSAAADPSAFGEGELYLGSTNVTTNGSGGASFNWSGPPLTAGHFVSATATGPAGTSEFSAVNDAGVMPAIHFSASAHSAAEGAGSVTITVLREGDLGVTSTIDYATSPASATANLDYMTVNGVLTFHPTESSKTIVIPLLNDSTAEPTEQFHVTLTNPNMALLTPPSTAAVSVTDDEPLPSLSIGDVTQLEGNGGTTTVFLFTVTLTNPSSEPVMVAYSTADGTALAPSDYAATSGTLEFAPGVVTRSITVNVAGDLIVEPYETFFVNLTDPGTAAISDFQGQGTIVDDDTKAPAVSSSGLLALIVILGAIAAIKLART